MEIEYCKRCCQPNTRPKIVFKNGVCGACLWEEEKEKIDWNKREKDLKNLANFAKKEAHKRGTHDCAIGVSGGKDSTFQALYARDVLGLNCLLVSAFPDKLTSIGEANFNNLVNKGFDAIRIHVNPKLLADLMKRDFIKYCHFRKATEYPLWASVYTVAKEKNIPMVIQGENAALTLGVSQDINIDGDSSTVYKTNTIAGETAYEHYSEINPSSLRLYQFPDLSEWGGVSIWLNYYVKDWGYTHNAKFSIKNGLHLLFQDGLLGCGMMIDEMRLKRDYGRINNFTCLDSPFHPVSQYHKFIKYGFGFTTDEVCYHIREGILTREEGFKLIDEADGNCHTKLIDEFCEFVGITRKEHDEVVDKFANKELMIKKGDRWILKPEIKSLR